MGRGARVGPSPGGGGGGPGGFSVVLSPARGTALARPTLPSSGWPRQRSHCGPVGCCSAQRLLRGCFRCKAKPSEWGGKASGWQGPQEAGRALMPAPPEKVFEPPIRGGAGRGSEDWGLSGVRSQETAATRVTLGGQTPAPNRVLETPGLHGLFSSSKDRLPGCPPQELTDTCSLALEGRSASCPQEPGGATEAPGLQGTGWDVGRVPLARAHSQPPPLCWLPG